MITERSKTVESHISFQSPTGLVDPYNGQALAPSNVNMTWGVNASPPTVNVANYYFLNPATEYPLDSKGGERPIPPGRGLVVPETADKKVQTVKKEVMLVPGINDQNKVYIYESEGRYLGYRLPDRLADYLAYNIWLHLKDLTLQISDAIPVAHLEALVQNFKTSGRFGDSWAVCVPEKGDRLPPNYAADLTDSRSKLNYLIKDILGIRLLSASGGKIKLSTDYQYLLAPYPAS